MGNLCRKKTSLDISTNNVFDSLEWFSFYTFPELQSALTSNSPGNTTEMIETCECSNLKDFQSNITSIKPNNPQSFPSTILDLLLKLNPPDTSFTLSTTLLSIGIIFCKEDNKYSTNVSYLNSLSLTHHSFIDAFTAELLKIYALSKCVSLKPQAQIMDVIEEYSYSKVSNERTAAMINSKIENAITNFTTIELLYEQYPRMKQYKYKNAFIEMCEYFYNETFHNESYIHFDMLVVNEISDAIALKQDNSKLLCKEEELKYLNNFTFTYFMNCLIAFDSKEKGKGTQLASTDLETLLSQQINTNTCELFFKYYFVNDNTQNEFHVFIENVTSLITNFESNNIKCGINPKIELTKLTLAVLALLYTNVTDCDKLRFIAALLVKNENIRKKNIMCDTLFLTWIYLSSAVVPKYKSLYNTGNMKTYEDKISGCKNRIVHSAFGDSDELSLHDFVRKLTEMETNFTCVYFRNELDKLYNISNS